MLWQMTIFLQSGKKILEIYLNGGFPCGWDGHLPEGKIVVFSNQ